MIGDPPRLVGPHASRTHLPRIDALWYLLIAGWFVAASGAVAWTWSYKLSPAEVLEAPARWPPRAPSPSHPTGRLW